MPRKGKAPAAQPAQTSANQAYGVAGEQQAAMSEMPLPNQTIDPSAAIPGSPGGAPVASPSSGPVPGAVPSPGIDPAMLAALATAPPGAEGLGAPSASPDEPVTAGMAAGPGAGPVPLLATAAPKTPVADTLSVVASANRGNATLQALADEAARRRQ